MGSSVKLSLRLEHHIVRKGWVIVLHTPNLQDMKSQVYRSKKVAERFAAERVMAHPELIGRIFVERGEQKL